jgi:hypothetical protein
MDAWNALSDAIIATYPDTASLRTAMLAVQRRFRETCSGCMSGGSMLSPEMIDETRPGCAVGCRDLAQESAELSMAHYSAVQPELDRLRREMESAGGCWGFGLDLSATCGDLLRQQNQLLYGTDESPFTHLNGPGGGMGSSTMSGPGGSSVNLSSDLPSTPTFGGASDTPPPTSSSSPIPVDASGGSNHDLDGI